MDKKPKTRHYAFVQNRECEYFPCHKGVDPEDFNCLFCYCPLYALGDQCGGHFTYTKDGIKNCTGCNIPHKRENYDRIISKWPMIMELAKKKPEDPEKP